MAERRRPRIIMVILSEITIPGWGWEGRTVSGGGWREVGGGVARLWLCYFWYDWTERGEYSYRTYTGRDAYGKLDDARTKFAIFS